jgi:asparagine synthase (glutamine-hydrolysing)
MNNKMAHRGPDDEGIFADTHIAIGQRRLSIIDLSSAGHQPMWCNDKRYCIVYNGELYNFKELRFDLERASRGSNDKPYHFKTASDTEVILAAYSRWGKDLPEKVQRHVWICYLGCTNKTIIYCSRSLRH